MWEMQKEKVLIKIETDNGPAWIDADHIKSIEPAYWIRNGKAISTVAVGDREIHSTEPVNAIIARMQEAAEAASRKRTEAK